MTIMMIMVTKGKVKRASTKSEKISSHNNLIVDAKIFMDMRKGSHHIIIVIILMQYHVNQ